MNKDKLAQVGLHAVAVHFYSTATDRAVRQCMPREVQRDVVNAEMTARQVLRDAIQDLSAEDLDLVRIDSPLGEKPCSTSSSNSAPRTRARTPTTGKASRSRRATKR